MDDNKEHIAIVGMSGRFPGAKNINVFWEKLIAGKELIKFFSKEELLQAGIKNSLLQKKNYIKASPILENISEFDAEFFNLTPREAKALDPQQRIFLECVWEALEDANYNLENESRDIGVFAGKTMSNYWNLYFSTNTTFEELISNDKDFISTYTSFKLNLTGPSFTVQSACSTSLVAVDLACQHLLSYQCNLAIAGGATLFLPQTNGYLHLDGSIYSEDGHCRPFDAKASGTIFGSGVGVVILKRLDDALTNGDQIHAVIKGSATNNDGANKITFTAPSVQGQAEVIAMAQQDAGISPESISYIEAHGTSTPIGDPIEVQALTKAYRAQTDKKQFCALGSVKSNVGHLDAAAGIAGLIKTVLALKHKQIPPSLHFEKPNPEIDFENSPFFVNTELREWKRNNTPLRAGVSSFGIGGTNAHVILEEAPEVAVPIAKHMRLHHLLTLSAKSDSALQSMVQRYIEHSKANEEISLHNIGYTTQVGRTHFDHRLSVVAESHAQLQQRLSNYLQHGIGTGIQKNHSNETNHQLPVFLFTGQGAQYANMGQSLYDTAPLFKEVIDKCAQLLNEELDHDLRSILWGEHTDLLGQTQYTQPALFALEYALAQLWQSWNIKPAAVMGHSVGEYVAACMLAYSV